MGRSLDGGEIKFSVSSNIVAYWTTELTTLTKRNGCKVLLGCRYEIEKSLADGSLAVKDIPGVWNSKMQEYLGVTPDDDAKGCLQDMVRACPPIQSLICIPRRGSSGTGMSHVLDDMLNHRHAS